MDAPTAPHSFQTFLESYHEIATILLVSLEVLIWHSLLGPCSLSSIGVISVLYPLSLSWYLLRRGAGAPLLTISLGLQTQEPLKEAYAYL